MIKNSTKNLIKKSIIGVIIFAAGIIILMAYLMHIGNQASSQWGSIPLSKPSTNVPQSSQAVEFNSSQEVGSAQLEAQQNLGDQPNIYLNGTGKKATQKFRLEQGLSIFNMSNKGNSNFAIWLYDSEGNRVDLLVNEIGSYSGSKAVGIETEGDYLLDVTGGSWKVDIVQPKPASAPQTTNFVGKGDKVTNFFVLNSGLQTFQMKHNGNSNFAIWLLDTDGQKIDLLANEIGDFEGSKALGIKKSGIYLLDITADGDWDISIN
jgi:hypothetical protein